MQQLHPKAVWIFFFRYIISFFFIGLWLSFALMSVLVDTDIVTGIMAILIIAIFLLIFVTIFAFIWAKLSYHFWRYELTEDAYKAERGIIWKRYVSIPYERIQNVDIYRGIIARILGLSDIQVHTAGYGGAGAKGLGSEGRLPGLSKEQAEVIRDQLISRAKGEKNQGL